MYSTMKTKINVTLIHWLDMAVFFNRSRYLLHIHAISFSLTRRKQAISFCNGVFISELEIYVRKTNISTHEVLFPSACSHFQFRVPCSFRLSVVKIVVMKWIRNTHRTTPSTTGFFDVMAYLSHKDAERSKCYNIHFIRSVILFITLQKTHSWKTL
jgi:hypothetical protein